MSLWLSYVLWSFLDRQQHCRQQTGETANSESKIGQTFTRGFPGISAGKESACNAGDPGLIPGSGRSPGEGIGYLFQYSWASLVAQLIKNPPAM